MSRDKCPTLPLVHICSRRWLVLGRGYRCGYQWTARRSALQGALCPAAPPETEMTPGISGRRHCRGSRRLAGLAARLVG